MIEEKFTTELISKIKEKHIVPKPRWSFIFKNYFLWTVGALSLIFGAISFSLIIYIFKSNENIVINNFGASWTEFLIASVPIFWLVFLATFIILFYLNLKRTNRAYRYSPLLILLIGLIASMILGSSFYLFGFSKKLDNMFCKNIHPSLYGRFMNPQIDFWSEPEEGRISGVISEIDLDRKILIIDKDGKEWIIYYQELPTKLRYNLEKGFPIKSFGKQLSENEFQAIQIMPMNHGKEFFNRPSMKLKQLPPSNGSL